MASWLWADMSDDARGVANGDRSPSHRDKKQRFSCVR